MKKIIYILALHMSITSYSIFTLRDQQMNNSIYNKPARNISPLDWNNAGYYYSNYTYRVSDKSKKNSKKQKKRSAKNVYHLKNYKDKKKLKILKNKNNKKGE